MKRLLLLFAIVGCSLAFLDRLGRQQAVAVQGRLFCNGSPASGAKIKLYDKGTLSDKKLAESYSDSNGNFYVAGSKKELGSIDPKVSIFHKCNYAQSCYRKMSLTVPKSAISKGKTATKSHDIGTLQLQDKFSGEAIDCNP